VIDEDDIIDAIRSVPGPVAGTSEIADQLPIGRKGVDKRLREMANDDIVETRMIGRVRIWWIRDS
jgi:Mn-dependent DtxR family transcriptional regulator